MLLVAVFEDEGTRTLTDERRLGRIPHGWARVVCIDIAAVDLAVVDGDDARGWRIFVAIAEIKRFWSVRRNVGRSRRAVDGAVDLQRNSAHADGTVKRETAAATCNATFHAGS